MDTLNSRDVALFQEYNEQQKSRHSVLTEHRFREHTYHMIIRTTYSRNYSLEI